MASMDVLQDWEGRPTIPVGYERCKPEKAEWVTWGGYVSWCNGASLDRHKEARDAVCIRKTTAPKVKCCF